MKKALLQMHLAVLLWGFTGVLGRAITLDAPMLVWYRMLLTALFMAGILFYRKQWVPIAKKDFKQLIWVGCLMGIHWVAFYGSIKLANASIALVCLSTASIFTTLTDSLIHRKKPDMGEVWIGLLAIAGVAVMYLAPHESSAAGDAAMPDRNLGIICGVVAAILSAVFTVLNKRIAAKYPARTMVFYEMGSGWIFISLLLPLQFLYVPETRLTPNIWDLIWLVILSLCCTVWAQSLALSALKHISSFTATLSVNLEPLYGIALAFFFFQENQELNWGFYAGLGLILFSVVLQMLRVLRPSNYVADRGAID
jgi:drug/metabolite transporter (DMT)-like permease